MNLQKELEKGIATCARCGEKTHYLLVDPVSGNGVVFCSWECLFFYAREQVRELNISHKGQFCSYMEKTFCQEGDCKECNIYLMRECGE